MASTNLPLHDEDIAFEAEVSEDVPLLMIEPLEPSGRGSGSTSNMGKDEVQSTQDASNVSDRRNGSIGLFPEAIVADSYAFKRDGKSTFDHDSAEEFYAPIAEYEGAHRYDPKFEWTAKEEKRVVRRVSST